MRKFFLIVLILMGVVSPSTAQEATDETLTDLIAKIDAGKYGNVHSLLVSHQGEVVAEAYFGGYEADKTHAAFSVTKSVISIGIGMAIEQGYITGTAATLGELLPDSGLAPEKQGITLEDLLTMQPGLAWYEDYYLAENQPSDVIQIASETDWVAYVLDKPMVAEAGSQFNYSSGTSIVLGAILKQATGQNPADFIGENLFAPLGITDWTWEDTPDGLSNGGWGLFLLPRDMVKIGELILNGGRWNGEQLVAEEWVVLSTQPQVFQVDVGLDYGYQWWMMSDNYFEEHNLRLTSVPIAWGFGGQLIIIAPELDVVVVSTAGNFMNEDYLLVDAVADVIFPLFVE